MPNTERPQSKFGLSGRPLIAAGATVAAAMAAAGAAPPSAALEHVIASGGPQDSHEAVAGPAMRRLFQPWARTFPTLPSPSKSSHSTNSTASHTTSDYSIPTSIVMCESGGNYSAVNPSTRAGGAYQILPSTWADYGGSGLPQNAPPAEQDKVAARIYATDGPGAWSCS